MNDYFLPTIDNIETFEDPFYPNCSNLQIAQKRNCHMLRSSSEVMTLLIQRK